MADEKKSKSSGGGGGEKKSNPFLGGAIVGLLLGVFIGWIIPVPSWFEAGKQQAGYEIQKTKQDIKNKAADRMESGADKLRDDGAGPEKPKTAEEIKKERESE